MKPDLTWTEELEDGNKEAPDGFKRSLEVWVFPKATSAPFPASTSCKRLDIDADTTLRKESMEVNQKPKKIAIIVHGGAWAIPDGLRDCSLKGVQNAVLAGYKVLEGGGSALDAVEAAVKELELDVSFDAGRGSVLNCEGNVVR